MGADAVIRLVMHRTHFQTHGLEIAEGLLLPNAKNASLIMSTSTPASWKGSFRGILLSFEFFFDRVTGFAKVRPLFPTTSQGCRAQSRLFETGRGVFVATKGGWINTWLA